MSFQRARLCLCLCVSVLNTTATHALCWPAGCTPPPSAHATRDRSKCPRWQPVRPSSLQEPGRVDLGGRQLETQLGGPAAGRRRTKTGPGVLKVPTVAEGGGVCGRARRPAPGHLRARPRPPASTRLRGGPLRDSRVPGRVRAVPGPASARRGGERVGSG